MAVFEEHEFIYGAESEKKTFYLAAGPKDGPLIIFVHGWPAIGKTWKHQLSTFGSLGFRAIAPDMPGYGRSSARKVTEDYSQKSVNLGMVALLEHLDRDKAVWIGHDWGAPAVWSFAEHYPEKVVAVAGLAVPSHTLEIGLEATVKLVDRDIYPAEKYPDGQWSYQRFYEEQFEKATAWFESDPGAFLRVGYAKADPSRVSKPAFTATVLEDGGWFGGMEKPDPAWRHIPAEALCIDEELWQELTSAMEKTSFWGADSWYMNHERNTKYFNEAKNGGYLNMPTLFIHANYDTVCDSVDGGLAEPQRKYCTDLTEVGINAGHWVAQEKPMEVSAAIARWIVEKAAHYWPGYSNTVFVTPKA